MGFANFNLYNWRQVESPNKHRRIVVLIINLLLGNVLLLLSMREGKDTKFLFTALICFNLVALLVLPKGMRAIKRTMGRRTCAVWGFLLTVLVCYLATVLLFMYINLMSSPILDAITLAIHLLGYLCSFLVPMFLMVPVFFAQGFYLFTLPIVVMNVLFFAFYLHERDENDAQT
jgi:hypothetical protein